MKDFDPSNIADLDIDLDQNLFGVSQLTFFETVYNLGASFVHFLTSANEQESTHMRYTGDIHDIIVMSNALVIKASILHDRFDATRRNNVALVWT